VAIGKGTTPQPLLNRLSLTLRVRQKDQTLDGQHGCTVFAGSGGSL